MNPNKIHWFLGYNNLALIMRQDMQHWLMKTDKVKQIQDTKTNSMFQGEINNLGTNIVIGSEKLPYDYTNYNSIKFMEDAGNKILTPQLSAFPYSAAVNGLMFERITSINYQIDPSIAHTSYSIKLKNVEEVILPFVGDNGSNDVFIGKWIKTNTPPSIIYTVLSTQYEDTLSFVEDVTDVTYYYPLEETLQPITTTKISDTEYIIGQVDNNDMIGLPLFWFTCNISNLGPTVTLENNLSSTNKEMFIVGTDNVDNRYIAKLYFGINGSLNTPDGSDASNFKLVCNLKNGKFNGIDSDFTKALSNKMKLININTTDEYEFTIKSDNAIITMSMNDLWVHNEDESICSIELNPFVLLNEYSEDRIDPITPVIQIQMDTNVPFEKPTKDVGFVGLHMGTSKSDVSEPRYPMNFGELEGMPEWMKDPSIEKTNECVVAFAVHNTPEYNEGVPESRQMAGLIMDPGVTKNDSDNGDINISSILDIDKFEQVYNDSFYDALLSLYQYMNWESGILSLEEIDDKIFNTTDGLYKKISNVIGNDPFTTETIIFTEEDASGEVKYIMDKEEIIDKSVLLTEEVNKNKYGSSLYNMDLSLIEGLDSLGKIHNASREEYFDDGIPDNIPDDELYDFYMGGMYDFMKTMFLYENLLRDPYNEKIIELDDALRAPYHSFGIKINAANNYVSRFDNFAAYATHLTENRETYEALIGNRILRSFRNGIDAANAMSTCFSAVLNIYNTIISKEKPTDETELGKYYEKLRKRIIQFQTDISSQLTINANYDPVSGKLITTFNIYDVDSYWTDELKKLFGTNFLGLFTQIDIDEMKNIYNEAEDTSKKTSLFEVLKLLLYFDFSYFDDKEVPEDFKLVCGDYLEYYLISDDSDLPLIPKTSTALLEMTVFEHIRRLFDNPKFIARYKGKMVSDLVNQLIESILYLTDRQIAYFMKYPDREERLPKLYEDYRREYNKIIGLIKNGNSVVDLSSIEYNDEHKIVLSSVSTRFDSYISNLNYEILYDALPIVNKMKSELMKATSISCLPSYDEDGNLVSLTDKFITNVDNTNRSESIIGDEKGRVYVVSNDSLEYKNNAINPEPKPERTAARICDIPTSVIQLTGIKDIAPTQVVDKQYVRTEASFTEADKEKLYNEIPSRWVRPTALNKLGKPVNEDWGYTNKVAFQVKYATDGTMINSLDDVDLTRPDNHFRRTENLNVKIDTRRVHISVIVNAGKNYQAGDMGVLIVGGFAFVYMVKTVNEIGEVLTIELTNSANEAYVNFDNFDMEDTYGTIAYGTSRTSGSGTGLKLKLYIEETYFDTIRTHLGEIFDDLFAIVRENNGTYIYQYDVKHNVWDRTSLVASYEESSDINGVGLSVNDSYINSIIPSIRELPVTLKNNNEELTSIVVLQSSNYVNIVDRNKCPVVFDDSSIPVNRVVDLCKFYCDHFTTLKADAHSDKAVLRAINSNNVGVYNSYIAWKWINDEPTNTEFEYAVISNGFNNLMTTENKTQLPKNNIVYNNNINTNASTTISWNIENVGVMMWVYNPNYTIYEKYRMDNEYNDLHITRDEMTLYDVDMYDSDRKLIVDGVLQYNIISCRDGGEYQIIDDLKVGTLTVGDHILTGNWQLIFPRVNSFRLSNDITETQWIPTKMQVIRGHNINDIGDITNSSGKVVNPNILCINDSDTTKTKLNIYDNKTKKWIEI